ncbi:unnamed protein product [Cylindrotheca closterium]|uniref:Uncharacterized protein n=1 Tax=Cylindrotheca closterium TaxID=2856 RepID=A0AAD2CNS0_9STRA|nr:unnamed protein product [Cylindrotheca closterium]
MVDKSRGFCLYHKNGSILRVVEEESEMQSIFSKVLGAFEQEQRKRYGGNGGNGGNDSTEGIARNESLSATATATATAASGNLALEPASSSAAPARVSPDSINTVDDPMTAATNANNRANATKQASGESSKEKASSSSPPPPPSTRRSRRQSSKRGGVGNNNGDEGLVSLTYSYGSMDWDAIEMCWKPNRGKRKKL